MVPPAHVLDAIAALPRPVTTGVRWAKRVDHITLRFWPQVDPAEVLAVPPIEEPATAGLGPGTRVLGDRVLVVPVDGLDELARAVGGPPNFSAHLTLARGRDLERLVWGGEPPRMAWAVESVVAFRSELRPQGARHAEIGRWPVPS